MSTRTLCTVVVAITVALGTNAVRADVYVAEPGYSNGQPAVLVFSSDATANEPPVRVIAGSNTGFTAPFSVTVDPVNEEIYVSDFPIFGGLGKILVFPLNANGNVAPTRTLMDGPNSQLKWPRKVAIDTVNDEIVVASFNIFDPPPAPFSSIRVYPRMADGDVAPLRSIYGDNTRLDNPIELIVDSEHDEIIANSYVAGADSTPGIVVFPRTADGDVAPARTIAGPNTQLGCYTNFLAYDPVRDELYADASCGSAYAVFPRTASGDLAPTRLVTGFSIGFDGAVYGLEYDAAHERVLVTNFEDDDPQFPISVQAFPLDADGEVPPIFSLSGDQTMLVTPYDLSIDAAGGFSGVGAQIYVSESAFDGEVDQGALTLETFNGGATQPEDVEICSEPLSSASNDDCFSPGQLVVGFAIESTTGVALAAMGSGFFGNESTVVGAVFPGDATIIHFNPPRTILALDALLFSGKEDGFVGIALYDIDGTPLGSKRVLASSLGTPAFFGVVSPSPVARAEVSVSNGTVMVDDLRLNPEDVNFNAAALGVDSQEGILGGNGVLEPGEQVEVAPSWRNVDSSPQALMGTASNMTGPPGATYTLIHDHADYGTLDPMATASCADLGVCYQMSVSDPATRPATHWDAMFEETLSDGMVKTWTLHLGESFTDVPPTNLFYRWVETLFHNGVTGGCGAGQYCPASANPRAQMPVFLLKALEGASYVPPACVEGAEMFADVPSSSPFCPWIEELARRAVTAGCGNNNYCPTGAVNRAQVAALLVNSLKPKPVPGPVVFDPRTDVVETFLELGGAGLSAGNIQIEHAALVDPVSGESVGRAVTRWQVVEDLGEGDAVIVLDCTIELADGNLNFYGAAEFNQLPAGASFSVIGGTGAYAGAAGTATVAPAEIGEQEGVTIAFELTR